MLCLISWLLCLEMKTFCSFVGVLKGGQYLISWGYILPSKGLFSEGRTNYQFWTDVVRNEERNYSKKVFQILKSDRHKLDLFFEEIRVGIDVPLSPDNHQSKFYCIWPLFNMGLKEYFDGKIAVVDLGEFEKKISEDEVDGLVEILLPNIELKAV